MLLISFTLNSTIDRDTSEWAGFPSTAPQALHYNHNYNYINRLPIWIEKSEPKSHMDGIGQQKPQREALRSYRHQRMLLIH